MTSPRSRKRRRLGPLLGNWDAGAALAVGGLLLWFLLTSDRPLEDVSGYLGGAIAYGVGVAGAAIVAGRWVSDRVKDSTYGEVIRRVDPEELNLQRPAHIVAGAGLATSLAALLLLLAFGEMGRTVTAVAYSVLVFLTAYSLFGLADLLRQNRRHLARMSALQATREQEERRRRGGGQ